MARQATTNKEEPQTDLVTENEMLKTEISELRQMFQQFMETQKLQLQEKEMKVEDSLTINDDVSIIPPNKLINITSLYSGGMTLRANNKPIRFDKFGITRPVTFEDLTYICSNHRNLAEEGCFFIHDQEAVKALYLSDYYKHFVNKTTIENLITLSHEKISDIFNNLTDTLKETVEDIIVNGIISNDSKYADRNKIDHISKLCGKNLYKLAQDQITD
ncbi:hypothetical protein [Paenibacillus oleatilyticus]|uniref:hypothetical protein n=1 Tax=Paenibacillus oleatilyticus TaxID=2594886 RepID=UPI001C201050|nr:hypothetical protein [Paenibacillus oleatilyticus]MBU7316140.1 hypothetical protein [Paenibacillus oleatilyticus]